jgi:hypothetical protein
MVLRPLLRAFFSTASATAHAEHVIERASRPRNVKKLISHKSLSRDRNFNRYQGY